MTTASQDRLSATEEGGERGFGHNPTGLGLSVFSSLLLRGGRIVDPKRRRADLLRDIQEWQFHLQFAKQPFFDYYQLQIRLARQRLADLEEV